MVADKYGLLSNTKYRCVSQDASLVLFALGFLSRQGGVVSEESLIHSVGLQMGLI